MKPDDIKERIYRYVLEYTSTFNDRPVSLGMLGRRFGKLVRYRCGADLEAFLRADKRFVLLLLESGATLVSVLSDAEVRALE
jgi:hypothetical protein